MIFYGEDNDSKLLSEMWFDSFILFVLELSFLHLLGKVLLLFMYFGLMLRFLMVMLQ
jgi:hypothetical protein